jgi:hypothetical protein
LTPLGSHRFQKKVRVLGAVPVQSPEVAVKVDPAVNGQPEITGGDVLDGGVARAAVPA